MRFIADLHIHTHYSRATSKVATLERYHQWAKIKGINVVGTGDFTHPGFFQEIKEKLIPAEAGFFKLKEPDEKPPIDNIRWHDIPVRFCLQTEISSIFKKHNQTRKVHSVIFAPNIETAARINAQLARIGNIASDGRPILGLDPKYLLEIIRDISPDAFLIPAHVWTPWFSIFGSKSGFDGIEECFEDLTDEIFALETGLSSDPEMNWRWSALDRFSLVSNSDAHSPQKLGRECNLFETDFSYHGIFEALKTKRNYLGTIEFYPQEGKYHFDGHRKCGICLNPEESEALDGNCPICHRKLTVGVMHRVLDLSDRTSGIKPGGASNYRYLIPLPEILAEIENSGSTSKKVLKQYTQIISVFGNEFSFLLDATYEDINRACGPIMMEGLRRMRTRVVHPQPGFDGEYGIIKVFNPGELEYMRGQRTLFEIPETNTAVYSPVDDWKQAVSARGVTSSEASFSKTPGRENRFVESGSDFQIRSRSLNEQQLKVLDKTQGASLVVAGPGTGKTRTLTAWMAHLVKTGTAHPEELLAITFTNKAAAEMMERLQTELASSEKEPKVTTFHSLCFEIVRRKCPEIMTIYDDYGRVALLQVLFPGKKGRSYQRISDSLKDTFEHQRLDITAELRECISKYRLTLEKTHGIDIALIVPSAIDILEKDSVFRNEITETYKYIAVDEFQDINHVQYRFLSLLLKPGITGSVLTIGDPDQAIYGFRGSDVKLFFQFQQDYQADKLELAKNYRSTRTISDAGLSVIAHNSIKSNLPLFTDRGNGQKLKIYRAESGEDEARFIADAVENLVGGMDQITASEHANRLKPYTFNDIAVLFRVKAIGRTIIPCLERAGIPLTLRENRSVLSQAPLSHAKSFLNVLVNNKDVVSLYDIFHNVVTGSDETVVRKILREMQQHGRDLICSARTLQNCGVLQAHNLAYIEELQSFITSLEKLLFISNIAAVLERIFEHYPVFRCDSPDKALERDVILETAREHGNNLVQFVRKINLCPLESESTIGSETVQLLTFHAAKGLEFRVVFITGAEEGTTPLTTEKSDLEEERRLFYVAVTRAQEVVYITHAANRRIFGVRKDKAPSRFIQEIPRFLRENVTYPSTKRKHTNKQLSLFQ